MRTEAMRTEARRTYERERIRLIRAARVAAGLTTMGTPRVGQSKVRLEPREKQRRRVERNARWWREVGRFKWTSKATGERIPVELPTPYHGHMWLDMARAAAGEVTGPVGTELRNYREDDIGEALLALLEGRDPHEAVRAYRRAEFVPRHLTMHFGDFRESDDAWRLDRIIPEVPSAEDEAVVRETVRDRVLHKTPYHGGRGKALMGSSRQSTPSNRRSNNR